MYWITRYMKSLCGWHGIITVFDNFDKAEEQGRKMSRDDYFLHYAVRLLSEEKYVITRYQRIKEDFYTIGGISKTTNTRANFYKEYEQILGEKGIEQALELAEEIKSYWKVENRYADVYEDEECKEDYNKLTDEIYFKELKRVLRERTQSEK